MVVTMGSADLARLPGPDAVHLRIEAVIALTAQTILVCGHLDDPGFTLVEAVFGGDGGATIRDFAIGTAPSGDGAAPVSGDFVALVAGDVRGGLPFRLRDATGAVLDGRIPACGDFEAVERTLALATIDEMLGSLGRLTTAYFAAVGPTAPLPADLRRLMESGIGRLQSPQREATESGKPFEVFVDFSLRVGDEGMIAKGWAIHFPDDELRRLTLVSLFGPSVAVPLPLATMFRPDVVEAYADKVPGGKADCGFLVYAPTHPRHPDDQYWFLEFETASGSIRRAAFRLGGEATPRRAIETVVTWTQDPAPDLAVLFERVVDPALSVLWGRVRETGPAREETRFGTGPGHPAVSVVVPLYGRIDFLRHQIASFSNDPDFTGPDARAELIYVLDDPRASKDLAFMAELVHTTYGTPFRVIDLKGNYGYSTANNAGAAAARGDRLLLLNSDVLPTRPGWLSAMADAFDGLADCGILGCRLLLEDGSIQHAGMAFQETPMLRNAWANIHPAKGLAVAFDPHPGPSEAAAVTGACLMIPKALYEAVGGLSTDYIIGDFEDSDLCLKVRQTGRRIWYTPEVELYHLERQSMALVGGGGWRQQLTLYNMWRHANRWRSVIEPIALSRTGT